MKLKSDNLKLFLTHPKHFRNDLRTKGIAILWMAITLLVLILFMGIAIDAARVHLAASQLQNAADAASLAGARWVMDPNSPTPGDTARQKAIEYAGYNYAANLDVNLFPNTTNDPNGDIVIGRFINQTRTFIPTMDSPNAMKVAARKKAGQANPPMPLVFGPIVHVDTADIERFSTAMIMNAEEPAIICCCDVSDCMYLHGNPVVNVHSGSIFANSIAIDAVDVRGSPSIYAYEFNIAGGDVTISGQYDFDTDFTYHGEIANLNKDANQIECPYSNLPEPAFPQPPSPSAPADGNLLQISTGTHTLKPGYYPGGIKIEGDATITLDPGIYQLGGLGLSMTGGSTTANEVMFHIVDGGMVDIRGNTEFVLTPPTSGIYEDISIFQSRSNDNLANINGTGDLYITGALYFPNNHVYITGDNSTIGSRLVACTIEFAGNGVINLGYVGPPRIVDNSFLVE
jgi:hypothetical protein